MVLPPRLVPPGAISSASFRDGTGQTATVSEFLVGTMDGKANDPRRTVFETPERLVDPDRFGVFLRECDAVNAAFPVGNNVRGMVWVTFRPNTTLYNHTLTPNRRSCTNGTDGLVGALTAGSGHPGVVNVLFGDGHVAAVADGVSAATWRAVSTRDGGEVVGVF